MNTKNTEKVTKDYLFNKNILSAAVATAMFGSVGITAVQAASVTVSGTATSFATDNSTSEFWIGNNSTLNLELCPHRCVYLDIPIYLAPSLAANAAYPSTPIVALCHGGVDLWYIPIIVYKVILN